MKKMSGYESVLGDPSVAETMKATMRGQQALAASPAKTTPVVVKKQAADVSVTSDPSVAAEMKDTQTHEVAKAPTPLAKALPKKIEKKSNWEGGPTTGHMLPPTPGVLHEAAGNLVNKLKDRRQQKTEKKASFEDFIARKKAEGKGEKKKDAAADKDDEKKDKGKGFFFGKKDDEKKASLDDKFAADLHQAVGIDVPEADPKWHRPDVSVEGQTNDRIDDHYLAWMREQADQDVVKEAKPDWKNIIHQAHSAASNTVSDKNALKEALRVLRSHGALRGEQIRGGAKALGGAAALGSAAYGGYRLAKGRQKAASADTGVHAGEGVEKQAGVIENPENLALIDRIRRQSERLFA